MKKIFIAGFRLMNGLSPSQNYIPELLRDDIPQALRGQRNVIFGNIEKIYEFHRGYFLKHLKQCEKKPLDIGRIFLKYVSTHIIKYLRTMIVCYMFTYLYTITLRTIRGVQINGKRR